MPISKRISTKPYHYVRFNWWTEATLDDLKQRLSEKFSTEWVDIEWDHKRHISLFKDKNLQLKVKADTLRAYLTPLSAVMFQKEREPFTSLDLRLREIIIEFYPRERPSPFPIMYSREPYFEVIEEEHTVKY
jgi:hypothetical protein